MVSAQRHGAGHVSLVSRGSQQRAFIEAGTAGLMTCMKAGASEHVNSDTAVPSWEWASPRKPGARGTFGKFQEPRSCAVCLAAELRLAASRSSEKPEPGAEPHMLICTAERSAPVGARAGPGLGLGQILLL